MKKYSLKYILSLLAVTIFMAGCDLVNVIEDPVNPNLSEASVLGVPNSSVQWIGGLERQLANATNEILIVAELASDNYENTQTFFNQFLDNLDIQNTDNDVNDTQFDIHRLREMAIYGLETLGPADENYSKATEAEFYYFRGVSHLLAAEIFGDLPAEASGPVVSETSHLNAAVSAFDEAIKINEDPNTTVSSMIGMARAKYYLGDRAGAVAAANDAIAADPSYLRTVQFDFNEGPTNAMQNAIWDRATFDDLQPNPRLDFLDPKYSLIGGTVESSVPFMKIEEAHLIRCEAAIADGALGDAQTIMKDIVALVATREMRATEEGAETRQQAPNEGIRPDSIDITVAASSGAMMRAGLVLNRGPEPVTVMIPAVSGTSVTDAMIDNVTSEDEALELLYLMRQEIFMAEGRRMTDLGIRLVVSEIEEKRNDNINEGDATTIKDLPSFITPLEGGEMDAFSYDPVARTCTITHDLNAIIVSNKTSDRVLPFH